MDSMDDRTPLSDRNAGQDNSDKEIVNFTHETTNRKRKAEDSDPYHCKKPKPFWTWKNFLDGPFRNYMELCCISLSIEIEKEDDLMNLLNKLKKKSKFQRKFEPWVTIQGIYSKVNKPSLHNRESLDKERNVINLLIKLFEQLMEKVSSSITKNEKEDIDKLEFQRNNSAIFWIIHTCGLITMQIVYEWSELGNGQLNEIDYSKFDLRLLSDLLRNKKGSNLNSVIGNFISKKRNPLAHRFMIEPEMSNNKFQSNIVEIQQLLESILTEAAIEYKTPDGNRDEAITIIKGDIKKVMEFHDRADIEDIDEIIAIVEEIDIE